MKCRAETHEQIGTKIAVEKDEEKVPEPIEEIEQVRFLRCVVFYAFSRSRGC